MGQGSERVKLGAADLRDREFRSYELPGIGPVPRYVLVTRLGERLFAIDDQCNHAGCLLSGGWLEERAIVCPCHEHKFDVRTGRNVTVPRLCADQRALPLSIVDGEIVVELPERP